MWTGYQLSPVLPQSLSPHSKNMYQERLFQMNSSCQLNSLSSVVYHSADCKQLSLEAFPGFSEFLNSSTCLWIPNQELLPEAGTPQGGRLGERTARTTHFKLYCSFQSLWNSTQHPELKRHCVWGQKRDLLLHSLQSDFVLQSLCH